MYSLSKLPARILYKLIIVRHYVDGITFFKYMTCVIPATATGCASKVAFYSVIRNVSFSDHFPPLPPIENRDIKQTYHVDVNF